MTVFGGQARLLGAGKFSALAPKGSQFGSLNLAGAGALTSVNPRQGVVFDAQGTANVKGLAVTTLDFANLTIGAGANRALVVLISFSTQSVTGVTVNWDALGTPQPCGLIISANTGGTVGRAELWGLVAPTSGNKTLRVSWTGTAAEVFIDAVSYSNVNQAGGTATFANAASAVDGGSTTTTVNVTSSGIDSVVGNWCGFHGFSTINDTLVYHDTTGSVSEPAGNRADGDTTVALTVTQGTAGAVGVGVSVKAFAGAATAQGASLFSGSGALAPDNALSTQFAANAFLGGGVLNAISFVAVVLESGQIPFAGGGAFAETPAAVDSAATSLAGAGFFSDVALTPQQFGAALYAGAGSFAEVAAALEAAAALFAGSGAFSDLPLTPEQFGVALYAGAGAFTPDTALAALAAGQTLFAGSGVFGAIAPGLFEAVASFAGSGVFTDAALTPQQFAAALYAGAGTFTEVARLQAAVGVLYAGAGLFSEVAALRDAAAAAFAGSGFFGIAQAPQVLGAANFAGAGLFSGLALTPEQFAAAVMIGSGQITVGPALQEAAAVALMGAGLFVPDRVLSLLDAAATSLLGSGSLLVAPAPVQFGVEAFSGAGFFADVAQAQEVGAVLFAGDGFMIEAPSLAAVARVLFSAMGALLAVCAAT